MSVQKLPYLGVLKLKDLPFLFFNCDTQPYTVSITDHPYYRSLEENDPSIFLSYYKSREHLQNFGEYSWEAFLAFKEKIRLDGWHPELGPPITVLDGGQSDGTHRLCILCHLYGPDTLVMIIDGIITYPVPQQQELIERFSNATSQLVLEKATQISTLENALAHCKNERDDVISKMQAVEHQFSNLENALAHCKNERDDAISQTQATQDHELLSI